MPADRNRYSAIAIFLHWVIALLIVGQIAGGIYMTKLPDDQAMQKFELYQLHKSFGVTILLLTLVRLGWRLTHRPPALPDGMKAWESLAARLTHIGFYVLLIVIPLVGWVVVSVSPLAGSVQTYLFGIVHLPHLPFFENIADREGAFEVAAEIHEYLAFATIGLLLLHVGAALKHHFVNKDNVLARMAPIFRQRS